MNDKEFWNADSAQDFLDRTRNKFLLKLICTVITAGLLVALLLLDSIAPAIEGVYLFGGLGALVVSGAVLTLVKVSTKIFKVIFLWFPLRFFNVVIAITFGGALLCAGLLFSVVPIAVDMLLLFGRRVKARQYIQP